MKQHELQPAAGSTHAKKRVGRGHGSGHVKTSGRGTKGQSARAGGKRDPRFEGGQHSLVQRMPYKRGFNNLWRVEYEVVGLDDLNRFEAGSEVTPQALVAARLVRDDKKPVKLLANGALDRQLTVRVHKASASARAAIEQQGGTVEELGYVATRRRR